ncbi:MAG: CoA-binding protein [Paenibacillaceae bacterium]
MGFENPTREEIKQLLENTKIIAVVGLSDNPDRTSYLVSEAIQNKGYRIIPVNPNAEQILGEKCYASLAEIPHKIDIVNVFRRSEYTVPIAKEAIQVKAKVLWLQLGVYNEEAALLASEQGITVIMDRCIKVEDSILLPKRTQ